VAIPTTLVMSGPTLKVTPDLSDEFGKNRLSLATFSTAWQKDVSERSDRPVARSHWRPSRLFVTVPRCEVRFNTFNNDRHGSLAVPVAEKLLKECFPAVGVEAALQFFKG
jgi:hypothetical protein